MTNAKWQLNTVTIANIILMNTIPFQIYLTSNTDLDEVLINTLTKNCTSKFFKKGEFLLHEGDTCSYSYFVENGLLRQYGIDPNGKEHILQFAPEGWFVTDRDSLFFKTPASYFIQALEDTYVLMIDDIFFLRLSESYPNFLAFNDKLLHNHIRQLTKRIYALLSATAEERYISFTHTYPDILLRVPQAMVASYLGITPESLSRVRKALATKNFAK